MKKITFKLLLTALVLSFSLSQAEAHFGMLIPDKNVVNQDDRKVHFDIAFTHPFEGKGMNMEKPKQFFVDFEGKKTDLLDSLKPGTAITKQKAWQATYDVKRPGTYIFADEPAPYWEPAEDKYIIHYTKTVIAAFGDESDWDRPVGLKTEIIPLLRPFADYAGNTFVGKVLLDGKPVPGAEVEVELYNKGQKYEAPTEIHVTQVVKADDEGIFSFTCPVAGWWGFAALNDADFKIKGPDGTEKDVELGAVLWVRFDNYETK